MIPTGLDVLRTSVGRAFIAALDYSAKQLKGERVGLGSWILRDFCKMVSIRASVAVVEQEAPGISR